MARKENFESALNRLEEIVQLLEDGELPLEECLDHYREGLRLHKICQERLGKVEQELSRFLEDDGSFSTSDPEAEPEETAAAKVGKKGSAKAARNKTGGTPDSGDLLF